MKKVIMMMMVMGVITASIAQTYTADTDKTNVKWLAKKFTGEHTGFIKLKEGNLVVADDQITGGMFSMDMASITNTDVESAEYNAKLVGHLKSDDFFGVENFPTATFKIKSVKAVKEDNATHHFTGDITIKGKTMELTIPAIVKMDDASITATSSFTIDRSKFDVKYRSDSFFDDLGDKVIYNDFNLDVKLVANK